jgi:hypothetical protein
MAIFIAMAAITDCVSIDAHMLAAAMAWVRRCRRLQIKIERGFKIDGSSTSTSPG